MFPTEGGEYFFEKMKKLLSLRESREALRGFEVSRLRGLVFLLDMLPLDRPSYVNMKYKRYTQRRTILCLRGTENA